MVAAVTSPYPTVVKVVKLKYRQRDGVALIPLAKKSWAIRSIAP